jgi:hypothetical protein
VLAIGKVGTALQLDETLGQVGLQSRWEQGMASGPTSDAAVGDVVVIDADEAGAALPDAVARWRDLPSCPGVVAIGGASSRDAATAARVTLLSVSATPQTFLMALEEAARLRYAMQMNWQTARLALGLPTGDSDIHEAARIVGGARQLDPELARTALRWSAAHYATDLGAVALLREVRALTIPEVEFTAFLDGTMTVQSLVRKGPLDAFAVVTLLWALVSIGGVSLTPEPIDSATPARRKLVAVRHHLRGRMARLENSTYYDVLEVAPAAEDDRIEEACRLLAQRYSPGVLAGYDLADLQQYVQPLWDLVEKSRNLLKDLPARGRYHDWLRAKRAELKTSWAIDEEPTKLAEEAFTRAQAALGAGEVHVAMSELAAACRHHPEHPEYEANLAWARYRVQVSSGRDRAEAARVERRRVDELLAGRRVWPRAMLAQALLCAADGDPDAARWHLREALAVDPNLPAAQQLLQRLGR